MCNACELMIAQANLGSLAEQRGLEEYPLEWQVEFKRLSSMIYDLTDRYQNSVRIHIWDPRSLQGLLKSIRYWVRQYPTWIINGQLKVKGWEINQLEQYLQADMGINDSEI